MEQDHSIKDACQKCGGTDNLDGVISPFPATDGGLETATLCAGCRIQFEQFCQDFKPDLEAMDTACVQKQ
jgi:hypothetical protein